jgi:hypothetical protein
VRAYYLNPALGRFLSADSVNPSGPGSQSYHRYAYLANNPTTLVDPSGRLAQGTALALQLAGLAQVATIVTMATTAGQLALVLPPFLGIALLPLLLKILIATATILIIVDIILKLLHDQWESFPDGIVPSSPPLLLSPDQILTATQTYPQGPNQCLTGALQEMAGELAWSILLGPVGLLDMTLAAFGGG